MLKKIYKLLSYILIGISISLTILLVMLITFKLDIVNYIIYNYIAWFVIYITWFIIYQLIKLDKK